MKVVSVQPAGGPIASANANLSWICEAGYIVKFDNGSEALVAHDDWAGDYQLVVDFFTSADRAAAAAKSARGYAAFERRIAMTVAQGNVFVA